MESAEENGKELEAGGDFITVLDEEKSSEGKQVFRANLKNEQDAAAWLEHYREETFTGWIVQKVKKEQNCQR